MSGIIPARAGFTQSATLKGTLSWDHPRSRGVYRALDRGLRVPQGSSPLARGLLRPNTPQSRHHRIIPARAGFTGTRNIVITIRPDHPRSRGVYLYYREEKGVQIGSSPLARGLLPSSGVHRRIRGDHPRSRGVYAAGPRPRAGPGGSSPLARGLPVLDHGQPGRGRIIPARAGFTCPTSCRRRSRRDHPRSRGVYAPAPGRLAPRCGSSPLARGLLTMRVMTRITRRIIPARAGFTSQK